MINLQPNIRLLGHLSDAIGKDWNDKVRVVDSGLSDLGMELSEEVIYLLFSNTPHEILDGMGECIVARPVIGAKKQVPHPLVLIDVQAREVWQESVMGETLEDLLQQAELARSHGQKQFKTFARSFMLTIRRRLVPQLIVECEVLFNE